jgi:hypothetical protein
MSWIKKKEAVFIVLIILPFILFLEFISGVIVKSRFIVNPEVFNIYNNYIDKVNHIRSIHSKPELNKKPTNLLFSTIRPYKSSQNNFLIQGDSWAEQIENKSANAVVKSIAVKNNYGMINAGTSSYSPSLMRSQLQILRDDFNIHPTHVVAIIDNTDMGDELCRYRDKQYVDKTGNAYVHAFTRDDQNTVYSLWKFTQNQKIYHQEDTFNLVKLFRLAVNGLDYRIRALTTHNESNSKCGWSKIASPMVNGISSGERIYLKNIINEYIKKVFDENVISLYIVTHPHRGHVNGQYILSVKEIIDEVIFESEFKNQIHLIGSEVSLDNLNIYKVDDLASHLTDECHANVYIPNIFNNIQ